METTLTTQANKYMDEHLTRELKDLVQPMREELTRIAEQAVKKMIRSTTLTLRADKAPSPKPELSLEELQAQLTGALVAKTTMTPEEIRLWEALQAIMSKETCSTEAEKLKRQRDEDDQDPNTQAKKHKHAGGSSSQQTEPVIPPTTTTTSTQQPKASGSGPKAHDHFEYTGGDDFPQPDDIPEPSSTKKKEKKGKHPQHKPDTSSKGQDPKKPKQILKWLDKDNTVEYSWFDEMIKA